MRRRFASSAERVGPLVAACVLLAAGSLEAQPRPTAPTTQPTQRTRRNSVQADLGLAVIGLAYERVLTPRIAVQVETHLFSTWFGPAFGFASYLGVGGQLRPSLFLLGDAPAGLYLAPFVRAEWVTAQSGGVTGAGLGWSSGLFLGYSFVFWNRLNLRLGAGGQYMSYSVRAGDDVIAFRSLFFGLDAIVGVLF